MFCLSSSLSNVSSILLNLFWSTRWDCNKSVASILSNVSENEDATRKAFSDVKNRPSTRLFNTSSWDSVPHCLFRLDSKLHTSVSFRALSFLVLRTSDTIFWRQDRISLHWVVPKSIE